jgi:hypothetical protein
MGSGGGPGFARREYSGADSASGGFQVGSGVGDALQGLSPGASGCLLTLALAAGAGAGDGPAEGVAPAALVDPEGTACRSALAALSAMDRADRARAIAGLLHRARAAVPDGIECVHPGWLRAVLESEATPVLRAITGGLPPEVEAVAREIVVARGEGSGTDVAAVIPDETLAELRRAAFASLVPMPRAADAERAGAPAWMRLALLPVPALHAEIERRGAATLGTSLAGAPSAVVARAAAAGGSALAATVLEAARRSASAEAREHARALVASAAARAAEADVASTTMLGLLTLAGELTSEAAQVIAQRLVPRLGRILVDP